MTYIFLQATAEPAGWWRKGGFNHFRKYCRCMLQNSLLVELADFWPSICTLIGLNHFMNSEFHRYIENSGHMMKGGESDVRPFGSRMPVILKARIKHH